MLFSSGAIAGLSERRWHFEPGEIAKLDFTKLSQGAMYGCEKYDPQYVSFLINFDEKKPYIDSFGTGSVYESGKSYIVNDVEKLEIGFPPGGKYTITSKMPVVLTGTDCDAGLWGLKSKK